ncbi:MAG: hypothetical protein V8S96_04270 [Lachnospiraceae bacterium]
MTAFSDVMTLEGTGERTFFHNRGACRLFGQEHMRLEELDAELVLFGSADFWMPSTGRMNSTELPWQGSVMI